MNPLQNTKSSLVLPTEAKDDGDFGAVTPLCVRGFGHARFEFVTGSLAAAIGSTDEASPLKIEECDTIDGVYTDVDDAVLADAIADTEDNKIFAIDVNLQNGSHKLYMRPTQPHAGDGAGTPSTLTVMGHLSAPACSLDNAARRGLHEHIIA